MKYYGKLGFDDGPVEVLPGVFEDLIIERTVYGDVLNSTINSREAGTVIPNQTITNQISVVADSYSLKNLHAIRYLTFNGHAWEVKQVEVRPPRIIMRLGGVYRGETFSSTNDA